MSVDWNSIGVGCVMTTLTHPFTYTKVLVQLGHEPLQPVMRRNFFFRKQLQYPSLLQYFKHITSTDGYLGLYRGLIPRICASATTSITYTIVANTISSYDKKVLKEGQNEESDDSLDLSTVCRKTTKEMISRCAAVIVSQPFHVIAIRTMAQFVGNETLYNNMYVSVIEIYSDEGITGFFAGIVPRLLCEIISLWLCNLLTHAVNNYVLTESSELKELREYTHMVMGYLAQTVTYPLSLTSTIMAVNGSNVAAGRPPFVPVFSSWLDCLKSLKKTNQTSRGSSMLFRKAVSHMYAAGSVLPVPAPSFS